MTANASHTPITYVEFAANDLSAIKAFYSKAFAWTFIDYGEEYVAFENSGIAGGFYLADKQADADKGSVLVVLETANLEESYQQVINSGGRIKTEIFEFPGGRRFHFLDPCNNELSVCCYQ